MTKKIAGLLAILTAAAALAVPAMAHDRDDYNYGYNDSYTAYTAYNGYNTYGRYNASPADARYTAGRNETRNRRDSRDSGRQNNYRGSNYGGGDYNRR
jgi:hypothetical protein